MTVEQEMHAKACIDRHTLKDSLVRPPNGNEVADMILIGKRLELGDYLVKPGQTRVGRAVNTLGDVPIAARRMRTLNELVECTSNVVFVRPMEIAWVDFLDWFGEIAFGESRHCSFDDCTMCYRTLMHQSQDQTYQEGIRGIERVDSLANTGYPP